jgi:hypothetical protein
MRYNDVIHRTALLLIFLCAAAPAAEVLVADYDGDMEFTDPDSGDPVGSEHAVTEALAANGQGYDLVNDIPDDLDGYDIVFVLLGTFPTSRSLDYSDQQTLLDFGRWRGLYMEGGDVGYDYSPAPLWDLFGARYLYDGEPTEDGNVETVEGASGTLAAGLAYDCPGYQTEPTDNYLDEITNEGGAVIFTSTPMGQVSNARTVAYAGDGHRRTVVSTFLFGSLADGSSTKAELMGRLLDYLGETMPVVETSWGEIKAGYR